MAGLGEYFKLNNTVLKADFDRAKADGKDYLIKMNYTALGIPMGMSGFGFLLDMIDFHEATLAVSAESMENDFLEFQRQHQGGRIVEIYNLAAVNLESADLGEDDDNRRHIQAAHDVAEERYNIEMHKAKMDARPWWRKALGLQP